MTKFPTYYEVKWLEDINRPDGAIEGGFIFATSYCDAAQQLEDYYGKDLMSIEKLIQFGDTAMIFGDVSISREICKMIEENNA